MRVMCSQEGNAEALTKSVQTELSSRTEVSGGDAAAGQKTDIGGEADGSTGVPTAGEHKQLNVCGWLQSVSECVINRRERGMTPNE